MAESDDIEHIVFDRPLNAIFLLTYMMFLGLKFILLPLLILMYKFLSVGPNIDMVLDSGQLDYISLERFWLRILIFWLFGYGQLLET